ncbi:MAG: hypothetical protein KAX49_18545 [Halanaerobiales bacterium]|nr:hypothetical protein [Halanaerobiales bacterium]
MNLIYYFLPIVSGLMVFSLYEIIFKQKFKFYLIVYIIVFISLVTVDLYNNTLTSVQLYEKGKQFYTFNQSDKTNKKWGQVEEKVLDFLTKYYLKKALNKNSENYEALLILFKSYNQRKLYDNIVNYHNVERYLDDPRIENQYEYAKKK